MNTRTKWEPSEAIADALLKHPDCSYGDWDNGLNGWLEQTIVVKLWRNKECWAANDPPRHVVEGYRAA